MIAPRGTTGTTRFAPGLAVVDDPIALAREAAERFAGIAQEACVGAGRFTVAFAGGSTPKSLYALLASAPYRFRIPWPQAYVFRGDERCVPPGLGADGHTASLFPHTDAARETRRWVMHAHVPKLRADRLTLTAPALNGAATILFLVAGEEKAPVLQESSRGRVTRSGSLHNSSDRRAAG